MTHAVESALRVLFIGIAATSVLDGWTLLLRRLGIRTLNLALLGRWIGHLRNGRWLQPGIAQAAPVDGERWIGWGAHYAIGVAFATLLPALFGQAWLHSPSLLPAIAIGIGTAAAPLFILQPALGAGIASSNTPAPVFNCLKSLANHAVFGCGLYLAALAAVRLFPVTQS